MSDTPQCPYGCGDLCWSAIDACWECHTCELNGPEYDHDGSKVRRLVAMPDETKCHEGLKAWEIDWLVTNFGGQSKRPHLLDEWSDKTHVLNKYHDGWFWRPTPPKEDRREGCTLAEVFEAAPDGESCWAEHPADPRGKVRVTSVRDLRLFNEHGDRPLVFNEQMLEPLWVIVTKAVGQ